MINSNSRNEDRRIGEKSKIDSKGSKPLGPKYFLKDGGSMNTTLRAKIDAAGSAASGLAANTKMK